MRANEFLNEALGDTFANMANATGDFVKQAFTNRPQSSGWSKGVEKAAQGKYKNQFVTRGLTALKTAINQGLVDTNSSYVNISASPTTASASAPISTAAATPAPAATTAAATPFTFGGEKYTKGPKGWVDSKGKPADANTIKVLDKAALAAKPRYKLGSDGKWTQVTEDRLQEIYKKLTTQEKFKRALKNAGYDPDLAAKRIEDLLAKHRRDRKEREEEEQKMGLEEGFPPRKYVRPAALARQKPTATAPVSAAASAPSAPVSPKDFAQRAGYTTAQPAGPETMAPKDFSQKMGQTPTSTTRPGELPSMGQWLYDHFIKSFFSDIPTISSANKQITGILQKLSQEAKTGKLNDREARKDLEALADIGWAMSLKRYNK